MALVSLFNFTAESSGEHLPVDVISSNPATTGTGEVSPGGKFGNGYLIESDGYLAYNVDFPGEPDSVVCAFWVGGVIDSSSILFATGGVTIGLNSSNQPFIEITGVGAPTETILPQPYPGMAPVFNIVSIEFDQMSLDLTVRWEFSDNASWSGDFTHSANDPDEGGEYYLDQLFVIGGSFSAPATDCLYDDISVWDDIYDDIPVMDPFPTSPIVDPTSSKITMEGKLTFTGGISTLSNDISTSGVITFSGGMEGYIERNEMLGNLCFSGGITTVTPRNEIAGQLVFSGGMEVKSAQGFNLGGSLVFTGDIESVRINKDVGIVGILSFYGGMRAESDIPPCSLPDFNEARWC